MQLVGIQIYSIESCLLHAYVNMSSFLHVHPCVSGWAGGVLLLLLLVYQTFSYNFLSHYLCAPVEGCCVNYNES